MADIELVIKIKEDTYRRIRALVRDDYFEHDICGYTMQRIAAGTPLPIHKGHGFIAICDSDFPITEEVKQELKNTAFVGNEDCNYCFEMTEIIEADKVESEE